jgi:hypothetical protein
MQLAGYSDIVAVIHITAGGVDRHAKKCGLRSGGLAGAAPAQNGNDCGSQPQMVVIRVSHTVPSGENRCASLIEGEKSENHCSSPIHTYLTATSALWE